MSKSNIQSLFDNYIYNNRISELIMGTKDNNLKISLIPLLTDDRMRSRYIEKNKEIFIDTADSTDLANAISSYVSEPERLKAFCKAYGGKIDPENEEIRQLAMAIVISSFDSVKLRTELMYKLLHRKFQGIVIASLPQSEETASIVEDWKAIHHYNDDETVEGIIQEGKEKLSRYKARGVDYYITPHFDKPGYHIKPVFYKTSERPVFGEHPVVESLDEIEPGILKMIENMSFEKRRQKTKMAAKNNERIARQIKKIEKLEKLGEDPDAQRRAGEVLQQ